jgi:alpha-tubulin suppressor-like RCC1 family protein
MTICKVRDAQHDGGGAIAPRVLAGLLLLTLSLLAPGQASAQEPIRWDRVEGATVVGDTVAQAGTAQTSGAASIQFIASGDGTASFVAVDATTTKAVGLSTSPDLQVSSLRYGLMLGADGTVSVVENGAVSSPVASYQAGDAFSIGVESGVAVIRHNGVQVHLSSVPVAYPLFAEILTIGTGSAVAADGIEGDLGEIVEWTNLVNASSPSAGVIVSSPGAPYGGGVSTKAILAGDGYVEFTVDSMGVIRRIGLSNGDTDQSPTDIDFGLYLHSGNAYAFSFQTAEVLTPFVVGDVFRIGVEGGVVKYRKNGVLFHTNGDRALLSAVGGHVDLLRGNRVQRSDDFRPPGRGRGEPGDVQSEWRGVPNGPGGHVADGHERCGDSLHARRDDADGVEPERAERWDGDGLQSSWLKAKAFAAGLFPGAMGRQWYSIDEPATTEAVEWTNLVKASSPSAGVIVSSAGAPYGGGVSTKAILAGDGYVEFTVDSMAVVRRIGLSNEDTDQSPTDIDFGLYLYNGNAYAFSFESDQVSMPFVVGDVLRIGVEGGVVKYRKNGVLFHTNPIAPSYPLLVDTSIFYAGTGFSGVTISGLLGEVGAAPVTFSLNGGEYPTTQEVTLQTVTSGAVIHYTLDGTTPTELSPSVLSGGTVTVSQSSWLKAKAFAAGLFPGAMGRQWYSIDEPATTEAVGWTSLVKASSPSAGVIVSSPGAPYGGGVSTKAILAGDGYVEFTVDSMAVVRRIGLSNGDTDQSPTDIDFGLYLFNGNAYAFSLGSDQVSTPFGVGDVLRIGVEGGVVKYRKNGVLFHTNGIAPSYPLLVDTSIYYVGTGFSGVTISGLLGEVGASPVTFSPNGGEYLTAQEVTLQTVTSGAVIHYTLDGTTPTELSPSVLSGGTVTVPQSSWLKAKAFAAGLFPGAMGRQWYSIDEPATTEAVEWTNLVKASSPSAGVIVSSAGAPYGGGVSTKAILAGDGYVEFTVESTAVVRRIGLSNGDTDQSPTDIDFGLYLHNGNAYASSFESDQVSTPFVVGDVFRIGVEGGVVKYRKNGVLFHTNGIAPSYPLLVDTSIYYVGTGFSGVTISGLLGEVGASPVTFSPNGGEYSTSQEVTLQTVTSGAVIHYTLDGTTPTELSPSVPSGGTVTVSQSSWLKAKAFAAGLFPGAPASQWYVISEAPATESVEWTNLVKASSPSAGVIVSSAGAPYGGGVSTKAILAGDGYVEFTVADLAVLRMIGLSNGDTDQSSTDIDFGLHLYNGNAYAFSFQSAQVVTPFVVGDVFRIGVEAGVVKYRKNGVLFHTNPIAPSYPLLVDTSMYYEGTGFSGVTISGLLGEVGAAPVTFSPNGGEYSTAQDVTLQTVTSGAAIHYTLDGTTPTELSPSVLSGGTVTVSQSSWLKVKAFAAGLFPGAMGRQWYSINEPATTESVVWTNLVKASSPSAGVIVSSPGAPYGGGVSTKAILAGDGYVEFTVEDAAVLRMIGLSYGDTDQSWTDIDFGLHLYNGNAYAFSFQSAQVVTPFVVGDVFRIGVEGGVVKYRKNGVLFHTNVIAPSYPLLVDTSMYYEGTGFSGVTISGLLGEVGAAPVTFSPNGGEYSTAQDVTLQTVTSGAVIHYTLDGTTPTELSPSVLSGGTVTVSQSSWLKAKAFAAGLFPGAMGRQWYSINEPATTEVVEWTNLVKASSPSAGVIVSSPGAPYGGGVSTKAILAGDGYVEFTVDSMAVVRRIGLSNGDTDQSPTDIDFGLYLYNGNAYALSFGSAQVTTPFVVGDVFRIGVEGGVVKYRKNGVLFHTNVITPSYPLLVDTSIYYVGTGFSGVTITGLLGEAGTAPVTFSPTGGAYSTAQEVTLQTVTSGAVIHYTLDGTTPTESSPSVLSGGTVMVTQSSWLKAKAFAAGLFPGALGRQWYSINEPATTETVEWTNLVKASSPSAGVIVSSAGAPYGGGVSTKAILAGDGYVEFTVEDTAVLRRIGLSNGDTDQSPADIDFGLQLYYGNAYALSFESAQASTAFVVGDVFRIGVEGGVVKYRKNGVLFHTNVMPPSYPLVVDTSMYYAGTGFSGVTISGLLGEVGAAPVTFSPTGGEYTTAQEVTLQTVTSGAVIHYTLDGTTPTESSPSVLSGGTVTVPQSSWLKAKAFAAGLFPGAMGRQWYSINEPATTEVVEWANLVKASSPSAGVIMSSAGAPYGGGVSTKAIFAGDGYVEFTVEDAAVLRRIGLSKGDADQSPTDIDFGLHLYYGNAYAFSFQSAEVSTPFVVGDVFRIGVEGGVVKYRKNGVLFHTNVIAPSYPLLVDTSIYYAGTGFSGVTISGHLTDVTAQVVFTPPAGNYTTSQLVALTSPAAGATIRYTTDGSEPTASSPIYSSPISVVAPNMTTLKAFAVAPGYINGVTTTAAYTFDATEAPVFSPPGGSHLGPLAVTATSATLGAAIHYTFNGADPSPSSPSVLSGESIAIPLSGTLKAIAVAPGLAASPTTSATYELVAVPPTISPEGGSFSGPVEVTLQATPGATIRYTTDGGVPDETSAEYTTPFTLTTSATVRARAFVAGWSPSATTPAAFVVASEPAAAPTFAPLPGFYSSSQSVTLSSSTPDATIYFTTDGTSPTTASTAFVSPIEIVSSTTIRAFATAPGFTDSEVVNARYDVLPFNQRLWVADSNVVLLNPSGEAWAWGSNDSGELGIEGAWVPRPVRVPAFDQARDLSSFGHTTVWIDAAGDVQAMGSNDVGQATGVPGPTLTTPTAVSGLPAIRQVRTLWGGSLALAVDGTVWAWGDNTGGQGGLGHFDPSPSLHQVPGLSDIVDIHMGYGGSSALRRDGVVFSWGDWESAVPTQLVQLPALQRLNQGYGPSSGVDGLGNAWMWGYNDWTNTNDPIQLPSSIFCSNGEGSPNAAFSGVKELRGNFVTFTDGSIRYLFDTYCVADEGELQTTLAIPPTAGSVVAANSFSSDTYVMVTDQGEVWTWGWANLGGLSTESPTDPQVIAAGSYLFQTRRPYFDPEPLLGPFDGPIDITLSGGYAEWAGVSIHYTTDGTDPDENSPLYTGAFVQQGTPLTIKARSFLPDVAPSEIATGVFTFTPGDLLPPTISPEGGSFSAPVEVALQASLGATIRYTLDGSVPDENSAAYTEAFTLTTTATVRARTFVDGWTPSPVASATFTIQTVPFSRRLWVNASNVVLLNAAGEAWAWGGNGQGQLGTGDPEFLLPVRAAIFDQAADLSSWNHTVWLNDAGDAQGIGANFLGQANGVPGSVLTTPVSVAGLPPLKKIRAGWGFTMALAVDGGVWVWGDNSAGQHGLGHLDTSPAPTQVQGLLGMIDIQVSFAGLAALGADGAVFTWGGGVDASGPVSSPVQVGSLPAIQTLNQGVGPFTGVDGQGRVWVWGQNDWRVSQTPSLVPSTMECSGFSGVSTDDLADVVEIRGYFIKFLDGSRRYLIEQPCHLGDGTQETTRATPSTTGPIMAAASAFGSTYVVIADPGEVWTWGWSNLGDASYARPDDPRAIASTGYSFTLGPPHITPEVIYGPFDSPLAVTIQSAAGSLIYYTTDGTSPTESSPSMPSGGNVFLMASGVVKAIATLPGYPTSPLATASYELSQSRVALGVAEGGTFTLLAKPNGSLWTWGEPHLGRIFEQGQFPLPIEIPGFERVRGIAVGRDQALVIQEDGSVVGWGDDTANQIAGTGTHLNGPEPVAGLPPVNAAATGTTHSLALAEDGSVWSWGANEFGKRGLNPDPVPSSGPAQIAGLAGVEAIAAGADHSLALKEDGTVWFWGDATLSAGATGAGSWVPSQIPSLTNILRIAAYARTSIAVDAGGTAWIWGETPWGIFVSMPVPLAGSVTCEPGEPQSCTFGTPLTGVAEVANGVVRFTDGSTRRYLGSVAGVAGQTLDLTEVVNGPADAIAIAGAGPDYGVVVTVAGSVWTWTNGPVSGDGGDLPRMTPGDIAVNDYTWRVGMPRATWTDVPFTPETSVQLSSRTYGAQIYYTLDGSTATEGSTPSPGSINAPYDSPLSAIAALSGFPNSLPLATFLPSVTHVAPLSLSPPPGVHSGPQRVIVTTTTPAAIVYYTVDGSTPNENSPSFLSGGRIEVAATSTLRVFATAPDHAPSPMAVAPYEIVGSTPVISPAGGSYNSAIQVTVAANGGGTIYYTVDGSEPSTSSNLYQGPFALGVGATVRARVITSGWTSSGIAEASYVIAETRVADPVLTPATGRWKTQRTVRITTPTPGASVHYTTDGTEPTLSSPSIAANGEFLVNRGLALKVRAFRADLSDSAVAKGSYLVTGQLAGGLSHALALKANGEVWGTGANAVGQVGDGGSTVTNRVGPVFVLGGVQEIAANQFYSAALKADGTVWTWGRNESGQLGRDTGSEFFSVTPQPVDLGGATVVAIAAGETHMLAVLSSGEVRSWGGNNWDQLGRGGDGVSGSWVSGVVLDDKSQPLTDIVTVSAGRQQSLALRANGTVVGWGLGSGANGASWSASHVPGLDDVHTISARGGSQYAIRGSSNELVGWGGNSSGQLGDGTRQGRMTPGAIASGVLAVAAGEEEVVFVGWRGRVWGSGDNTWRQLGDATTTDRLTPVRSRVPGMTVTVGSGGGAYFTAASDGKVWSIGRNTFGQLGWGYQFPYETPEIPSPVVELTLFDGSDLSADSDSDGLILFEEFLAGTDPFNPDTNGNGLLDGIEYLLGDDGISIDSDGDGLSDDDEFRAGTDPFSFDTDGDGYSDSADLFPLDPDRHALPVTPGDTTPPVITLLKPSGATIIP